jgi:hypothetical protein
VCNPGTGVCSNPIKENGSVCDDGNACTLSDTCQGGTCRAGDAVRCEASDQCHAGGTCNPSTGVCSNPIKENGAACNDGNACTLSDTCQSGTCAGSNPVTCTAPDACHAAGTCDPQSGTCSTPPPLADGSPCSDDNACTAGDVCQTGTCVAGSPVTCAASDQCHLAGTCDPQTGACSDPAAPDATACDDGDVCTTGDTCQAGTCGGTPVGGNGATRTLGFFKVHETALQACLDAGPIDLGIAQVSALDTALGILWATPAKYSDGTHRSTIDSDRLLVARQLLVAVCNERLFGATPPSGLLSDSLAAINGTECASMTSLESQLASFNESNDTAQLPSGFDPGSATPVDAMNKAQDPTTPSSDSCSTGVTP